MLATLRRKVEVIKIFHTFINTYPIIREMLQASQKWAKSRPEMMSFQTSVGAGTSNVENMVEYASGRIFNWLINHRTLGYSDDWITPSCQTWHSAANELGACMFLKIHLRVVIWFFSILYRRWFFQAIEYAVPVLILNSSSASFEPQYRRATYSVTWKYLSATNDDPLSALHLSIIMLTRDR